MFASLKSGLSDNLTFAARTEHQDKQWMEKSHSIHKICEFLTEIRLFVFLYNLFKRTELNGMNEYGQCTN
jgi:hypothetical protein